MKQCPSCLGDPQPLQDFYRCAQRTDGRSWECKKCMNQRVYGWRAKNKNPRTIPAHGNKARYRKGCRCELCVRGESRYRRQLYLYTERKPYVRSGFAKAHLRRLELTTPYEASRVIGIAHGTAMRIWRGDRIRVTTERKILAVEKFGNDERIAQFIRA